MKKTIFSFIILTQLIYNQEYYYQNNIKVSLEKVHMLNNSNTLNVEYYKNEKGILLGITDQIIVKTIDVDFLEKYAQEHNVSIEKKLSISLYLLKVKEKSQTLTISNELHETENIEYAHPDFIKKRMLR